MYNFIKSKNDVPFLDLAGMCSIALYLNLQRNRSTKCKVDSF